MHMSDALLSPAVGGVAWVAAAGLTAHAARSHQRELETSRPALMGVVGAFVFAAQMINFTIPGTGASGHLGGGLLLSILLGPHAAFLVMASVLGVQALLFADGGLLALGCNIVNLGFFTCLVAYPLLFRPLAGRSPTRGRLTLATLVAAVAGLLMGAMAVVLETTFSGISLLPFGSFVLFMLPIHFGIGIVEGLVTASVVLYVWRARPELLRLQHSTAAASKPIRRLLAAFAAATVLVGGAVSWFASTHPDGLEWAIGKITGQEELASPDEGLHGVLERVQETTALMPDYSLRSAREESSTEPDWPAVDRATSLSGIVGGGLTLLLALGVGYGLHALRRRRLSSPPQAS
ncbi:energy-coupling factor ABC transporter permease [Myxococcota bacterium]